MDKRKSKKSVRNEKPLFQAIPSDVAKSILEEFINLFKSEKKPFTLEITFLQSFGCEKIDIFDCSLKIKDIKIENQTVTIYPIFNNPRYHFSLHGITSIMWK